MARFSVPVRLRPYVDALINCTHDGIYGADLAETCLVDMPIVWYFSDGANSRSARAKSVIAAVEQVSETRLRGIDREVVDGLLGMGKCNGLRLTERHDYILHLFGYKHWDQFRDDGRHRFLNKLVLALEREAAVRWERTHEDDYVPYVISQQSRPDQPPYRLRDYYVSYLYPDAPTGLREVVEVRELIATRPTTRWIGHHEYRDDGRVMPRVRLFGDAELRADPPAPGRRPGYLRQQLVVTFPMPLQSEQSCRFVLHKLLPVSDPDSYQEHGDINNIGVTPIVPIERYTVQVRHGGGRHPRQSWTFDRIPGDLVPGDCSDDSRLRSDGVGLEATFMHLRKGLAYGLAWEW